MSTVATLQVYLHVIIVYQLTPDFSEIPLFVAQDKTTEKVEIRTWTVSKVSEYLRWMHGGFQW